MGSLWRVLFAALAGLSSTLSLRAAPAPSAVEVLVDGQPLQPLSSVFRLPASHKSIHFKLGRSAEEPGEGSRRMRFMLEGVDSAWRQMPSEMSLMVRFADTAGDQVGQQIFRVSEISAGWKGTIGNSSFTGRHETVRVPAEGGFLTVAMASTGPPTAMGVYVVRDLRVVRETAWGPKVIFTAAAGAESPEEAARGWSRSGTRPSMARMVRTGAGEAFCIVDDDPSAHAEWHSSRAIAPAVRAGESLTVEWSEMYDIGMGNRFEVNYGRLNPGTYRFLAEEEDATGQPLGAPARLALTVPRPAWRNPWCWLAGVAALGLLLWWACRAIIRRRIRQHLTRIEQEHLVERERLRIARDLHDDLGARLTHISLVSGLAENDAHGIPARESFARISGMARELVAALYQTVWTVNPENDHLEALVNYLGQLTEQLGEAAGIPCRIHSCTVPAERRVTSEIRHHITLAVKEALHNALRHAQASEITARMEFDDPRLLIVISDNGRGFDPAAVVPGHGLANMRRRMESIGGRISVENFGPGTRIRFEVPIPATPSA